MEASLDILAPAAAKKGLELVYAVDEDLPVALVGDAGRLRQIVLNLLSNAVKFTEAGEVLVTVGGTELEAKRRGGPARWEIRVDVRDTGIGIPDGAMDHLFQSFSQVDASIARRYGGTGPGPGHLAPPGGADGRHAHRGEHGHRRRRQHLPPHRAHAGCRGGRRDVPRAPSGSRRTCRDGGC